MIEHLVGVTISTVAKRLVMIRSAAGAGTLGRVLTLVAVCAPGHEDATAAVAVATARQHPMRIIVVSAEPDQPDRLDAEIRVGADSGASDVIILRTAGEVGQDQASLVTALLLADAPIVAWWADAAPSAPADTPLGRIAARRITDVAMRGGVDALRALSAGHVPGDTDLSWARLTRWREFLAAELDQSPGTAPTGAEVLGRPGTVQPTLLAAWLRLCLGTPVQIIADAAASDEHPVVGARLLLPAGPIGLRFDPVGARLCLAHPDQPDHEIVLHDRTISECLSEELRSLSPDVVYSDTLTRGVPAVLGDA
jgi:glucose-6-phosphate dehydrogenase assembly protein OpcA